MIQQSPDSKQSMAKINYLESALKTRKQCIAIIVLQCLLQGVILYIALNTKNFNANTTIASVCLLMTVATSGITLVRQKIFIRKHYNIRPRDMKTELYNTRLTFVQSELPNFGSIFVSVMVDYLRQAFAKLSETKYGNGVEQVR